jgi:uncharacterized protein (TIGR02001 family)
MQIRSYAGATHRRALACIALLASFTLPVQAVAAGDGGGLGATLALVSDYVVRGFSQTQGGPAIQAGASYASDRGWTAGIWGSNVDFVGSNAPPDGARTEYDLYLGRAWLFGERWSADATVVRYAYPGTLPGIGYDYSELVLALHYGQAITATICYSNDAFGTGHDGVLYEIGAQYPLAHGVELSGRFGDYRLARAFAPDYRYYSIGLERNFGKLTVSGRYHDTDGAAERIWGDAAGARFTLQLSVAF